MKHSQDIALVTPSFSGDFVRCRMLCESVDLFVDGPLDHYILVDDEDYIKFSQLAGTNRYIINELDILPDWLHTMRPGITKRSRKVWWSTRTWPMRGWHVQQLRRIGIAHHVPHAGLLYCDSDMMFVRRFSPDSLWNGKDLRLYRVPYGINDTLVVEDGNHRSWTSAAASMFNLPEPGFPAHDYINNLVSWRRDYVVEMCAKIEKNSGKDWVSTIGSNRTFSECQIYGAFADGIKSGEGHWHAEKGLCETYWIGGPLSSTTLRNFVDGISKEQVAVGIQSFTGTDPQVLRQLILG